MNPYLPQQTKVKEIISEAPNIKTFILEPEDGFVFQTGQFIQLTLPGVGEAPFTPSSNPQIKEYLEITVMNVGKVTSLLHSLSKEAVLGLRGPYGKGYPLEEFQRKDILIVGGGVGLAPLRSLILDLANQRKDYGRIYLRYGARSPQDIIYKNQFKEWQKFLDVELTVDKKDALWKGRVGVVTSLLDDLKINLENTVAVVCGPPIMMKFTTLKLLDKGILPTHIYLSMEKNMSCGLGKCGHCRLGKYYVCRDGPVFRYSEVKEIPDIWD